MCVCLLPVDNFHQKPGTEPITYINNIRYSK